MESGQGEALLEIVKLNTACQFRFAKLLQKGFNAIVGNRYVSQKRFFFTKFRSACQLQKS